MANKIELEKALLGSILSDRALFHKVKGQIIADDFADKNHAIIFDAILAVYEHGFESIEMAPIVNKLTEEDNLNKVGGTEYLASLLQQQGLSTNVFKYIKEITEAADARRMKVKIEKAYKKINADMTAEEMKSIIDTEVMTEDGNAKPKDFIDSKTAINDLIEHMEEKANGNIISGVPVDFTPIDKITGGFQRGSLVIVAARPSMGKTALALNMAANAAQHHKVAFFSLEMPTEELSSRVLSFSSFVEGIKIRDPQNGLTTKEWSKIHSAKKQIEKMQLYIDDTAGIKLQELMWKVKRLHRNVGLDIVFIDYLQLITTQGNSQNRQNEVSMISRNLKVLARELSIPIVALAQLSRDVEKRENKRPMMSDLRESGAIEQDADIVSFVYRESYYNKENEDEAVKDSAEYIIAKHRNGPIGDVKLVFKSSYGLFTELGESK